jgi:hypothetical protein
MAMRLLVDGTLRDRLRRDAADQAALPPNSKFLVPNP